MAIFKSFPQRVESELDQITETVDKILERNSFAQLLAESEINMDRFHRCLDERSENEGGLFIHTLIGALAVVVPPEKWQMCLETAASYRGGAKC